MLRNIELSELPLSSVALRAARLARLLNDFDFQRIFEFEVSGYPHGPTGLPPESWRLAAVAGRQYQERKSITKELALFAYTESIEELEQQIRTSEAALTAAADRNVSISSSNPNQMIFAPPGNSVERLGVKNAAARAAKRLASRRAMIYAYVLRRHYELQFSGTADDIFTRIRDRVDASVSLLVPDAVQRFNAVYDNLRSENQEDWSNAVHSCRRILQDLADVLFPPSDQVRERMKGGKQVSIKLGREQYINRIVAYVEDHAGSRRYEAIVGSELAFLGDRLDAVFRAAQKGSHDTIVTRSEADRYVLSTYLIIGDVLGLGEPIPLTVTSTSADSSDASA